MFNRAAKAILEFYSLLLLAGLWEAATRTGLLTTDFLPPFSRVVGTFYRAMVSGDIPSQLILSLMRSFSGFLIAVTFGVLLGISMALSRRTKEFFDPLVAVFFPIPATIWIPLSILWLGLGNKSIIALITISCFFPMVINSYFGVKSVKEELIWSARSMGYGPRAVVARVILPGALPSIFSGLRISLPISLILVIVAEMVMGNNGIGFFIINAQLVFEIPEMFAGIVTVTIVGFIFDKVLMAVRGWWLHWYELPAAGA